MATVTPARDPRTAAGRGEGDGAIIARSQQEPECFAEVFDRHYDAVHGYAARRLGASLADDVAAETFLIAFGRKGSYDVTRGNARPWLYGIASNLISRHHRSEVRQYRALARTGVPAVAEGHADLVAGRLDARARRGALAAALGSLSSGDRDVLLLVAWAQLSLQGAAEALGIPDGTARSRLHRARKKIRAALGETDPLREDLN
ncbi:RNA polymerase sigma factor [Actinomadura xylanilytica]|uniref:RNA polymerase sigma factor n=1 Tax=Actinomadura xylanilytica TaxID=887459 RepID=UPI00255A7A31|nr:RNA polymerase sigma factor [Actinomadura xylanilytica]MDL4772056.1 RNA polymerase sigma factor [Actinomadura xylanilytica]